MKSSKRITIIGNAGSGKSTLAQRLHAITKLPIYHLDQYFWKPGWQHPDPAEYKIIHDSICDKDEWIIDGMNLRVLEHRIQRADIIIFLDIPRSQCFTNIFKRTWHYYGRQTPSSAPGCSERFNWEFFKFLKWVWDFKKRYPHKIMGILNQHSDKEVYILKSRKEIDAFLRNFSCLSSA
ncbi:MAG: hypothetical protein AMXMBFR12_08950 [Candidatus Babeliales bacterium]